MEERTGIRTNCPTEDPCTEKQVSEPTALAGRCSGSWEKKIWSRLGPTDERFGSDVSKKMAPPAGNVVNFRQMSLQTTDIITRYNNHA